MVNTLYKGRECLPKILEIAVWHKVCHSSERVNTFLFSSLFVSSSQLKKHCINAIASMGKIAKAKFILKCNRNALLNSYLYFPGTRLNSCMRYRVLKTLDRNLLSPCFCSMDSSEIFWVRCVRKNKPAAWNESPITSFTSSSLFFNSSVTKDVKQMHNYLGTKDFQVVRARKMDMASLDSICSPGHAKFLMINCRLY